MELTFETGLDCCQLLIFEWGMKAGGRGEVGGSNGDKWMLRSCVADTKAEGTVDGMATTQVLAMVQQPLIRPIHANKEDIATICG